MVLPYPVVVTDLDGTLFNESHMVSEYTQSVMRRFTAHGGVWIIASGRHYMDISGLLRRLKLKASCIGSNGTHACLESGAIIYENLLPPPVVRSLFDLIPNVKSDAIVSCYRGEQWLRSEPFPPRFDICVASGFKYTLFAPQKNPAVPVDNVCQVSYVCRRMDDVLPLQRKVAETYGDVVNVAHSGNTILDIVSSGVNKCTTLEKLVKHLGYRLEDCLAFGDAMNDAEMLRHVGKGCIMKNGQLQLRQTLPDLEIIGPNKEDSVAKYIEMVYGL